MASKDSSSSLKNAGRILTDEIREAIKKAYRGASPRSSTLTKTAKLCWLEAPF